MRAILDGAARALYNPSLHLKTRERAMETTHDDRFETRAIHAGQSADPANGALMTPVYFTSTFLQDAPAVPRQGYEYSRTANPTRTALQANLASLEGAAWGLCF